MKKTIRFVLSFALLSALLFLAACSTNVPTFRFVNHALSVECGETIELELLNESAYKKVGYTIESIKDGNGETVSPVNHSSYATLSATTITNGTNCYVTVGEAIGTVTIKAYLIDDIETNSIVVVTIKPNKISSMQITSSVTSLAVGETAQFTASTTPSTGNQEVTWSTSNEAIATVSATGLVTAKAVKVSEVSLDDYKANQGALITIIATSTTDTSMSARKTLLITAAKAESVEITGNSGEDYNEGSTVQLTATVYPEAAYDYVSWTSSDESIASVSPDGLVTTQEKGGVVTITATTVDGKTATTSLSVAYMETKGLTMTPSSYTMVAGTTYTITKTALKLTPVSANPNVTYDIVDPNICSITDGILTALAAGTTVIHVTSFEGTLSADFTLTVYPAPTSYTGLLVGTVDSAGVWKQETTLNVTYEEDGSITIIKPTKKTAFDFKLVTDPDGAYYNSQWSISSKKAITTFYNTSTGFGHAVIAANKTDSAVITVYYRADKNITVSVTVNIVSE